MSTIPKTTSPMTHITRAFGWNLGKVIPSAAESQALSAAGVTDPTVQRYAVWRRSLLIVASVWTIVSFLLATLDSVESGIGELTTIGIALEFAWLAASAGLVVACLVGIFSWKRPGSSSALLVIAWLVAFLLPFLYALLPASKIYRVHEVGTSPPAQKAPPVKAPAPKQLEEDEDEDEMLAKKEVEATLPPTTLKKLEAIDEIAIEFVLSGSGYLLLLPAVLSIIPGAVNGCLRIKALMPASQLPGWLLVCAAPLFLLFWVVILVIANHAAQSALLVFGIIAWAGAPIWYSLRGKVFVQSQIGEAEAARIGGVKRLVLITTLIGGGFLAAFVLTSNVAGLKVIGFNRADAVSTKIEKLTESEDEVSLEDVQTAVAESKYFLYALDLSSWRFVVDFLAKLFIVTALFADLILRATLIAWNNDRRFRTGPGTSEYDATSNAALTLLAKKPN